MSEGSQEALIALPSDATSPGARGRAAGAPSPADSSPVARVVVDNPLPHLDRPFDYLVPASLDEAARPGVRVRVRFAGKLTDAFLLERVESSEHQGALLFLDRVISPERVLTPEIAALARGVADRYAGTLSDVLRLAIPPRHARAEAGRESAASGGRREAGVTVRLGAGDAASGGKALPGAGPEISVGAAASGPMAGDAVSGGLDAGAVSGPGADAEMPGGAGDVSREISGEGSVPSPRATPVNREISVALPAQTDHLISGRVRESSDYWGAYPAGLSFLAGLREGRPVRAVWTALPGGPPTWPGAVAEAVRQTVAAGRGVVVVVPDGKDVALVGAALDDTPHVAITADLGPAERYRRWLRVLRGEVAVAVGNRATAFAPVRDLGLAVLWDDGDDLHSERLAPYPHAREVLATRVHAAGAAMLIGGYARTAEGTRLIATGWARPLAAARDEVRRWAPRVRPAGDDAELGRDQAAKAARLPSVAWRALKAGLERGPVLVQVPRRGYLPALNCQDCRTRARCTNCSGPLALTNGHAAPYCRWCGRIAGDWRCHNCGSPRLRAAVVGARRTAEELGRAFPSTRVTTSGRDGVLASVPGSAALVVATPGAEPVAEGGYAAAALLDGWAMLSRPDLRAAEEALRRWLNAAALVRPGGEVVVLTDGQAPVTQALVRWDPVTHAERELRDRAELGFPPVTHVATLTGSPAAIREMLGVTALPEGVEVLGPVPVGRAGEERAVLRAPKSKGAELARVLKGAAGVRSARKAAEVVRVDIDPLDLL
ncbi:primosomal protein N' [Herbidospora yilanensis]|uniref:primosomal protein N' n=1 Tax=Herbidospora yilanensis TaxID=354426 RepID=UPI000ACC000A|nr:primosomal protein N' [Herbidospora yilanensis]